MTIAAVAVLTFAVAGCGATFTNPVKETANDPFVVKDGSHYLLVESTERAVWITRSAEHNLTDIADGERTQVWSAPGEGPNCRDVWAPELHHMGDKWYIYYAATTCDGADVNRRMFVLESVGDDPLGPYVDRGKISDADDRWAIDGTRFELGDRAFYLWSGWPTDENGQQNLYIAEMSSPTKLKGRSVLLSEPTLDFE